VGRRLVLTAVLGVAALGTAPTAQAGTDWQVHRAGPDALVARGEEALRGDPDDEALARRLVHLAGAKGAAGLRARFHDRAASAVTYAPVAAYGQLLLALGEAKEAAAVFARALELAPRSSAAQVGRAHALAVAGATSEALVAYDLALGGAPGPPLRRRIVEAQLALLAHQPSGGDPARRIALRRELVLLSPDSDIEAERLADALEAAGQPAEAARALERRLPTDGSPAKLALTLRAVRLRLADGEPADADRAAVELPALVRRLPNGARESRRAVWTCAREVARRRGALGPLATTLAQAPGTVEQDILGQVRDELGDLEGALAATRAALDGTPRDAALGRRMISLLDRLGREEEAITALADLQRRIPDDVGFATELTDRQLGAGNRAGAGAALDRASLHFARRPDALQTLAECAARADDHERAMAIWQRLRRLEPTSAPGIVGLGEAQFQAGRKDDARRTWSALRGRAGSPMAGHLRLAEILLDHDMFAAAVEEVRSALALDPESAPAHRLLGQVYERQRRLQAALDEWSQVLAITDHAPAAGDQAELRREARRHRLALLAQQGRGQLDAEVRRLQTEADAHPGDLDGAVFLAEAQQRLGDTAGATSTLRAILGRAATGAADPGAKGAAIEAGFALARLAKRAGQLDEAAARLEELSRLAPERAPEAQLQIAGIALERYDVPGALAHVAAIQKGSEGPALARVAELQERAGADPLAADAYRRALSAEPTNAPAALGLSRIELRRAGAGDAARTLEDFLRSTRDDASLTEVLARALPIEESLGRLPELVESLAGPNADGVESPARARALVEVFKRLVPALYRDPARDAERTRLGRRWLRPLLELVTDVAAPPDRTAIELLGMLGNGDAAPALSRIVAGKPEAATEPRVRASAAHAAALSAENRLAAIVALGRLADPRGFSALESASASGAPAPRAAAIWGLGRIADPRASAILQRALTERVPDIQAAACLGLGRRASDDPTVALLIRLARDPARPPIVRRAAAFALGQPGRTAATPALLDLLDAGDAELSRAAASALARAGDPRALPALLARALLPRKFALADAEAPLAALGVWLAARPLPDEARLVGGELNLSDLLTDLAETPAPADLARLWRAHTRTLADLLGETLTHGGELRRDALAVLDSRRDGPGLGALAPQTDAQPSAELASALREVALPLAERLAILLDDPDPEIRGAALRVLAKLDDARATPARVADAVADGSPPLTGAAVVAARQIRRSRPPLAASIAAAVGPLLSEDATAASWRRRLAAVEVLAELGPPGRPFLDRAAADRHPVVRQAAREALTRSDESR
jgi:tetratricopeptide (TPR) repeat protein/HEAT repeat protein